MPEGADKNIIKPSKQFKKSTYKVIAAIVLFIVVYILLLLSTIAIALALGWLGVIIITALSNFLVLILGAGFILSGLMLVFFLIKFIFTKGQQRIKGYEIKELEQPELFAFIKKVAKEVGTSSPKHVYLTNDVNASASFQPTFFSLFLPIRKDLNIGLGLINTLNQSEFKAVIAHEFGHFSQRSMRFGSYVYHLNRALYNLLYENEGYNKALNAWGRWHYMLRFSALMNVYIIKCIQEILRKVYVFVNKTYMQLSREMEFHADAIATYASGANNIISSLRRMEIAEVCYNQIFPVINSKLSENLRPANIYELQIWFLKQYAEDYQLDTDRNGLPIVNKKLAALNNSQVALDNLWYSHPLIEDREKNTNQFNLNSPVIDTAAWELFNNAEALQKRFTDELYASVNNKDELTIIDVKVIAEELKHEKAEFSYNKIYKGFYNGRGITAFSIQDVLEENRHPGKFSELFTDENCALPKQINGLNEDINKLDTLIETKNGDIRSFDFKGVKYYPADAPIVKDQLTNELNDKEFLLAELDKDIFTSFYEAARNNEWKTELIGHYEKVFKYQTDSAIDYGNYNMMRNALLPVYTRMSYTNIYATVNGIYDLEKDIKPRITQIIEEGCTKPFITDAQKNILNNYLKNKWVYFLEPKYDNKALAVLNDALNTYIDILSRRNFEIKNKLLEFQIKLIG